MNEELLTAREGCRVVKLLGKSLSMNQLRYIVYERFNAILHMFDCQLEVYTVFVGLFMTIIIRYEEQGLVLF